MFLEGNVTDIPNEKISMTRDKNFNSRSPLYSDIYVAVLSAIAKSGNNLNVYIWVMGKTFSYTCTM